MFAYCMYATVKSIVINRFTLSPRSRLRDDRALSTPPGHGCNSRPSLPRTRESPTMNALQRRITAGIPLLIAVVAVLGSCGRQSRTSALTGLTHAPALASVVRPVKPVDPAPPASSGDGAELLNAIDPAAATAA